ncbi:hypothetical protein F5Y13DRAFT_97722 [Hypoxylon sp. FL1857]|nr:hypothetical protein F5Y13DRAFT_97722 [Hypoxylon sp. FL1857]
MSEPFSIAAGIVGILTSALHCTRVLYNDIQSVSRAPTVVEDLKRDLLAVTMTLESLQGVTAEEWAAVGQGVVDQSTMTITTCTDSCTKLRADLERWIKHSNSGKLSWQDRVMVGFWKSGRIKSMSEQLQKHQIALNLVISTATLHCSIRDKPASRQTEEAITNQETEITGSFVATDRQLAVVDNRPDPSVSSSVEEDEETSEQEVIENERVAFRQSLKILKELRARNEDEARRVAREEQKSLTRISFGNNNNGFQLGTNSGSISGITFGGRN